MLNVSKTWKENIFKNAKTQYIKAIVTLSDGTVLHLDYGEKASRLGSIILGQTVLRNIDDRLYFDHTFIKASFYDDISGNGEFSVGNSNMKSFSFSLDNGNGVFDQYSLNGAIIQPSIGMKLPDGTVEWVMKQKYIINGNAKGSILKFDAFDYMCLSEIPFSELEITYPITLGALAQQICTQCYLVLDTTSFTNNDVMIHKKPALDGASCRTVLGYIAQVAGANAIINRRQSVEFKTFQIKSTADVNVDTYKALETGLEDTEITGIFVESDYSDPTIDAEGNGNETQKESVIAGTDKYAFYLKDNPLIPYGSATEIAQNLYQIYKGLKFRTVKIDTFYDPSIEVGDVGMVANEKGESFLFFCNKLVCDLGTRFEIDCNAQSESENSNNRFSGSSQAVAQALQVAESIINKSVSAEKLAREQAVANLQTELNNSSGLYETTETAEEGGTIRYFHNKPKLSDSSIVWKYTSEAFGVSTDGGATYPFGFDISGTVLAEKIFASDMWLTGGLTANNLTITGNSTFQGSLNGATGTFGGSISATNINIEGSQYSGGYYRSSSIVSNFSNGITISDQSGSSSANYSSINLNNGNVNVVGSLTVGGSNVITTSNIGSYAATKGDLSTLSSDLSTYVINSLSSYMPTSGGTFSGPVYFNSNVYGFGIATSTSSYAANVRVATTYPYQLLLASSSSERYKMDIVDICGDLDPHKLYDLPVRQYKYKPDYLIPTDMRYMKDISGFIAEEVLEHYPIACEIENGIPEDWNVRIIVPPMLKLIQEQHLEIENIKTTLKKLEEKLS